MTAADQVSPGMAAADPGSAADAPTAGDCGTPPGEGMPSAAVPPMGGPWPMYIETNRLLGFLVAANLEDPESIERHRGFETFYVTPADAVESLRGRRMCYPETDWGVYAVVSLPWPLTDDDAIAASFAELAAAGFITMVDGNSTRAQQVSGGDAG